MPRRETDRNLLFGILALQMDFITRDALVNGMNAWVLEKHRPLGEILVERNNLDPNDRALLDPMVDRHIAKHDNDPAASLAALSSLDNITVDLQRSISDSDLTQSLASIKPSDETTDFSPLRPVAPVDLTSTGVRFRKVRDHARGGLGVVFVARDEELHREVALKEIQDRHADDRDKRARFLMEAEITGGLEHPGIVPVYGLGHYDDGRPFYAMRFIKGDSLKEEIARFHADELLKNDPGQRNLALQKLLRRFLDVCNAVAYAHSRGVLHRDLKPDNVMVGKYGETLVVDWGLAKATGRSGEDHTDDAQESTLVYTSPSGSAETMPGSIIGTPAYMSPEQAAGRLELLGPRSDVYSLGATLYSLLTGRMPFADKVLQEVLRKVEHGEFPRPRESAPWLDPALEAITFKAMALKSEDRYNTPQALAEDLERWLGDEPVKAYREPWTRQARRWAKRNRTAVTAAAAALLVGLVGLGAVAAVQTKARNDLATKNRELDRKNTDLIAANKAKDEQRERAEKNEIQAVAAVKKFGDVIANEPGLKQNPALEALRKRLLNEPLAFFKALRERLLADQNTRPESLARLALASFDLGYLTNEIGDKRNALVAYRESLAVCQQLANDNPNVADYQSQLARTHKNIGNLLIYIGQHAEGLNSYNESLRIQQTLADAHPSITKYQSELASTHDNIGVVLNEIGRSNESLKAYNEALAICQKIVQKNPDVTEFQSSLAFIHNNIGVLLSRTRQTTEALKAYNQSLAIRQKIAQKNPEITEFQYNLSLTYNNIAILLSRTGQMTEALKAYNQSLAIRQKIAQKNPEITEFQTGLAVTYNNIGLLLSDTGQDTEALKAYSEALVIRQKLANDNPAVTNFQSYVAHTHNNIGLLLSRIGQKVEALDAHKSALAIRRKLAEENPKVIQFQNDLAASHNNVGILLSQTGQPDAAIKALREMLAIQQKLAADYPEDTWFQKSVATGHNNIGSLLNANGQMDEAMKAYEKALMIRQKLANDNPTETEFRNDLAASYGNIARQLSQTSQPDAALKAHRAALAIRRKLAEENTQSPDFASYLGATLNNIGLIELNKKRFDEARFQFREAIEWQRKALAANPANLESRKFLINDWTNLIIVCRELGDTQGVADAQRQLTELRDSDPALIALDARLSAILKGDQRSKDNRERLALAQRAYDKGLHAGSAKLWAEAFEADPKTAETRDPQNRYNAACAAALAGCGQGKDDPAPDSATQARLREQARGWLVAELAVWAKLVESGPAQARGFVVQTLKHWKEDSDLLGVRDPKALEALPESERKPWVDFWAEVEALLAKASK
jgi:serine/threonine-protein kinase